MNIKNKFKNFIKNKKGGLGLRPYIENTLVLIIFTIFALSFMIAYLQTNNPTSELLTNTSYGLSSYVSNLNQSLNEFGAVANNASATLSGDTPAPSTFIFLIFEGAFYIPKMFLNAIIGFANFITAGIFPSLMGTGAGAVLVVIMSITLIVIIITIVFLVIKAIRTGETER